MRGREVVDAFDELERRRRKEAAALREWLVRVTTAQHGSISSPAPDVPHHGVMALLLDLEDVSDALGVSVPTVKRLVRAGSLPAVKVAGATRVRRCDLEAYVAELDAVPTSSRASTSPAAVAGSRGSEGEGSPSSVDPPAPIRGLGRSDGRPAPTIDHHERTSA